MRLSILVIDLVGYSERLAALEEQVPDASQILNRQIEQFVGDAITAAKLDIKRTVLKFTGDGAIARTDDAERAHRIAAALQHASANFNAGKHSLLGKRLFRVGIATGEVSQYENTVGDPDLGGSTIGRAARMEAGCKVGGIAIDQDTYSALPADLRLLYAGPEEIVDKNKARYVAYRFQAVREDAQTEPKPPDSASVPVPANSDLSQAADSKVADTPTDCTGATRLQTALFKRIDEIRQQGTAEQKLLLQEFPQCASRSSLDKVLNKADGGRRFIEVVRHRAIELRQRHLADSLAHELVLLFLVGAERQLQEEVGNRCQRGILQLAVDSQTFGCVLGACLRNCGVHLELDLARGEIYASNVISDLPLAEAGHSQELAMRHELSVFEQRALGVPLDASRQVPSARSLGIRLEILEQKRNLRPALALPAERTARLLSDPAVADLAHRINLDVFQFSSTDGIDLRDLESDLREPLAFILPTIKTR